MLNKNDPLIGAVQEVMKKNQAEREAARLVNEKFGVHDRKAVPHERQGEWDAAYKQVLSEGLHPNQQKLDVHEPEKDKLTKHDFKMLRAKKKPMEEDVTSPSAMGIKKPDYATGTPDYANKGPQMVNRAAKTSAPAGTVKEENLDERVKENKAKKNMIISKIGAKARKSGDPMHLDNTYGKGKGTGIRVDVADKIRGREISSGKDRRVMKEAKTNPYAVGMAAVKKSTGDEPPMEKKNIMKAHKIAKKIIAKKKMDEDFKNRHNSSVNASVEEQVVAELYAAPGTPASFAASSSSVQAAERQRRMGERRADLIAKRQQSGDVAPRPQPNMALQRQQSGDVAPRPQPNMALRRQQSGDVAPRPQSSVALQRRQSGDVAPKPQPNMALRRQQSGDVAPRPQGQASPMMGQGTSGSRPAVPSSTAAPVKKAPSAAAPAAKKAASAAAKARPVAPVKKPNALQRQMARSKTSRDAAVTGPSGRRG